jgi:Zn finger protein HypA/HybF involved in hydrogenase expression
VIDTERKPFWAKCQECGHIWPCAYTPMMMTAMAKLLKGLCCPSCGADSKRITPAKQSNGELQELGSTASNNVTRG